MSSSKQNCNDTCQEDPVESAGAAYGGDRGAQPLESVEVQEITTDERPKASGNIGEGRGGTTRN